MIGPVFFVLLETSIRKGARAALALDLGVLLSDLVYILIAYVFYSEVAALNSGEKSGLLKIIGGSLFMLFAFITFFKKVKEIKVDAVGKIVQKPSDYVMLSLKGFLLNLANPMVIFYWFSVMTLAEKNTNAPDNQEGSIFFFILVLLITFFSFDLLKIFGAKKLRPLVTHKVLVTLNRLIGIVFFGFGIFLIIKGSLKI
jgi:threonine/homoserine/homoserine lactone efflux protein